MTGCIRKDHSQTAFTYQPHNCHSFVSMVLNTVLTKECHFRRERPAAKATGYYYKASLRRLGAGLHFCHLFVSTVLNGVKDQCVVVLTISLAPISVRPPADPSLRSG